MSDSRGVLEIAGLGVRLGAFELRDVSMTVRSGEVVGLLGHNGSGKSTTFRIIADIVRPASGSVRLGGLDHRADERAFKQKVSFIGDNKSTYRGFTVAEVLEFTAQLYPRWDQRWCEDMCKELRLPVETKVKNLSTGMQAKLGLVLGFSPHPEFVVMDEATSGLDLRSTEWIWRVVEDQKVRTGLGVLMSSHKRDEVSEHCDRVVVLDDGQLLDEFELGSDARDNEERIGHLMGERQVRRAD